MITKHRLITADELLMMPDDGKRHELIRGVLSEKVAPGYTHGEVESRTATALSNYSDANDYGTVISGDPGHRLERNPDTVRAPDVAWIAPGRVPAGTRGYPNLAPDLAVEVKSPSNSYAELADKALMWLSYGSREVWMIDPERVTVTRYRPGVPPVMLYEDDILDGGALLPGFTILVWRLFRRQR